MSTGDINRGEARPGVNLRYLILSLTVGGVLFTAVYFLFLRELLDVRERVETNRQLQKDVTERVDEAAQQNAKQKQELDSFKRLLKNRSTLDNETLSTLLDRLKDLEQSRAAIGAQAQTLRQQASKIEGERARNRARVIEAYDAGRRVQTLLKDLDKDISAWTGGLASLQTNDLGKKVATRPELVAQVESLAGLKTATFEEIDRWRRQLDAVFPRIKRAYEDKQSHTVVTPEDIGLLKSLEAKAAAARDELRKQQRALRIVKATAQNLDPGQKSLADVLTERKAARDAAYLRQIQATTAKAIATVNKEYAGRIAREQRKQRVLLNKQKLEAEQLRTKQREKELAEIERQRKALEERIARQKLEAEYRRDMAAIQSLLAPFLDNAITQPAGRNPIAKGGPRKPTSLGALRASGALKDTKQGLDFLFKVGGHPANLRAKGSFPSFTSLRPLGSGAERERVRKAQQLLIKYGPLLVRDGKLSP